MQPVKDPSRRRPQAEDEEKTAGRGRSEDNRQMMRKRQHAEDGKKATNSHFIVNT